MHKDTFLKTDIPPGALCHKNKKPLKFKYTHVGLSALWMWVNVAPELNVHAEGSLFILEPERCVHQWHRTSCADNARGNRALPHIEQVQRKQDPILQLTVPVVPNERWFICCVRGPIMFAGCMDMGWSRVGVITAPCKDTQHPAENTLRRKGGFLKNTANSYHQMHFLFYWKD